MPFSLTYQHLTTINISQINLFHCLFCSFYCCCFLCLYFYQDFMTILSSPIKPTLIIIFPTQFHLKVPKNPQPFIIQVPIKPQHPTIQSYHHQEFLHYYPQSIQYLHLLGIILTYHLLFHLILHPIFILPYQIIISLILTFT